MMLREILDRKNVPKDVKDIIEREFERKTAEMEVQETSALLETIFDHTDTLLAHLDSHFNFIRVNHAYAVADEREASFFPGKNHFELYPDKENELIFQRVVETGEPFSICAKPFIYPEHPEQGISYWDWSLIPIKDAENTVKGLALTLKNVTERAKLVEAIRESEKKFRNIIESLPLGVHIYQLERDGNLRFMGANSAADKILGVDNTQYIGKTIEQAFPEISKTEIPEKFRTIASEGGFWKKEDIIYLNNHVKGVFKNYNFQTTSGNMVSVFNDITKRKQTEEELRKHRKNLEELNKKLRRQSQMTEAINSVLQDALKCETLAEVGRICLTTGEELTKSKFGFIGLINETGLFDTIAISDPGYAACKLPGSEKMKLIANMTLDGIDRATMREGKSRIVNDPANHPDNALDENKRYNIEHRVVRPNGEERFVNERAEILYEESGKPIIMIGTVHDITDRKKAENALQESEERYALAQKAANLGSWDWNILTGALRWSEQVEPMFGYSRGEFVGTYKGFLEIVHPADRQFVIDSVNASVEEGEEYDIEHRIVWPDGTVRWISEKGDVLLNETGEAFRMLGVVQDITKRKKAEIALAHARDTLAQEVEVATSDLREEKQRIETVVETIPDGIAVIDREGKIYLVNKVFKDYYHQIYDVDFPTSLKELSLLKNPFGDTVSKLFYSEAEESITIEPIKGLHLQLAASKLIIPPNTHLGVIIAVRDVTPFVELDNLRKQFVSVVSHELRTPITAINLSLRNLQKFRKKISEEQLDEIIDMTADSALVLTQMIEDLLIASRIEADKIKLQWKSYQLKNVVQSVLNVLDPRRVAKSIDIQVGISQKIKLYGDEKRINQIFRILVDNAIKYSEKNSPIIIKAINDYHGKYNPNDQKGVLIQVIDSGRGIPKEDLPYIFDRFFRSKDVNDKRGSGLGLSIAQEMVGLHYGEIFVNSEYRKGSTFSVFLPRKEKLIDEPECDNEDHHDMQKKFNMHNEPLLLKNRTGG